MAETLMNRREMIQLTLASGAALLLPASLSAKAKKKKPPTEKSGDKDVPAGQQVIPEDNAMAKALGYRKNADKVDVKQFPNRATVEGKTQFCDNCVFYAKVNDNWGSCSVLGAGVVASKGWCTSWAKKPG